MLKKFGKSRGYNGKLGILLDSVKALIITLVICLLIVFFASAIVHNLLRVGEVSSKYTGKYKKLYAVQDKMMNIYVQGNVDNPRTIVLLPEFAVQSPTLKYKALADKLSDEYKVVIVEYLGYGFSLSTKEERTNEKIVNEVREGLQKAEIYGPYILMPFSTSNIYASYYAKSYRDEVLGIISVDGMYAKEIENESFKDEYLPNLISNVKFYSTLSLSGLFRWDSYINPKAFSIDKMLANSSYGKDEIKVYRNLLANKFLTKAMKNEIYKLKDNMKEMVDYKYPENLPTLQILTSENISEYKNRKEDIEKYAKDMITNEEYQKIKVLDGTLENYLFDTDYIKSLKNLISLYF